MSKRRKMSMIIFMIMIVGIFTLSTRVEAALQANGGTVLVTDANTWIAEIRKMQATGGTLGLTDTINTNLTSSNKNMDVHMEKNTEYGAMVILSASSYGNPNKITDGQTTTGNASGVVMKLNSEWVAAGTSDTKAGNMGGAAKRYWNVYTTNGNSVKKGDATTETAGWHGSGVSQWLYHYDYTHHNTSAPYAAMVRALSGSIFSYDGRDWQEEGRWQENDCLHNAGRFWQYSYGTYTPTSWNFRAAFYGFRYASRAAVVVGSGV